MANQTPVEKLRAACAKRGVSGIRGLGRTFLIMDTNRDKLLSEEELTIGIRRYGISEDALNDDDISILYKSIDANSDGKINFDEFLVIVRPPMSKGRVEVVERAFAKLDSTGNGVITVEDIEDVYDVTKHPKYLSGEKTKRKILQEFLAQFEVDRDEKVTLQEFLHYYAGVSASIDKDVAFDYVVRQAWKL